MSDKVSFDSIKSFKTHCEALLSIPEGTWDTSYIGEKATKPSFILMWVKTQSGDQGILIESWKQSAGKCSCRFVGILPRIWGFEKGRITYSVADDESTAIYGDEKFPIQTMADVGPKLEEARTEKMLSELETLAFNLRTRGVDPKRIADIVKQINAKPEPAQPEPAQQAAG